MGVAGRILWVELNAQKVGEGIRFYEALFAWTARPLHVAPWGSIPLIASAEREIGNQFMAMGAFAPARWVVWIAADLEAAGVRVEAAGGRVRGTQRLGDHREELHLSDPEGHEAVLGRFLDRELPATDRPGEPAAAEFWGGDPRALSAFWGEVLGLAARDTPRGVALTDDGVPRLLFAESVVEVVPPRWVPMFRTASLGADLERARRLGAVSQMPEAEIQGLGRLAVLADPIGAAFGLIEPA